MIDLRDGRISDQLLQGEDSAKALIIVNYIDVIDLIHVFSLLAHLFDTFGHTPILVHHDHLGTHQTTGGVLVVFQQVHDITGLLYVLDMRKELLLGILVQLTHQVNGIIRFHVIDEMRKQAEEMSEIYYVYVVDDDERLKGVLPLQKLITHPSVSKIKHVMKKDPISVRDSDSIEEVSTSCEKPDANW